MAKTKAIKRGEYMPHSVTKKTYEKIKKTVNSRFLFTLLRTALPLILAAAASYGIGLADSIMLRKEGDALVGAIYAGVQIQTLLSIITVGFDGAILLISAQHLGAEQHERAMSAGRIGLISSLIFGTASALLTFSLPKFFVSLMSSEKDVVARGADYLRTVSLSFPFLSLSGALSAIHKSKKRTSPVFFSALVTLSLKILLNFLLIPKRGLALYEIGAAISTVISRITESTILAVALFISRESRKRTEREPITLLGESITEFFKYGTPVILSQLVWAINTLYSTAIIGRYGNGLLAGLGIANTLNSLSAIITSGLAGSAAILLGREIGSGNHKDIRRQVRTAELLFIMSGIAVGICILVFCRPFISLYSVSDSVKNTALGICLFFSALAPLTAYQSGCMTGIIKSRGEVRFILLAESVSVFLIIIPLSLLAATHGATPLLLLSVLKSDSLFKCSLVFSKLRGTAGAIPISTVRQNQSLT